MIIIYDEIKELKFIHWKEFFICHKLSFAWIYIDLKETLVDVCKHKIILEDDGKPIHQRQPWLNPKYLLINFKKIG